jgi:prepilin-type N-terminal cleavage/methylation domain-containing protein
MGARTPASVRRARRAFSLIELIGVLAIIAIIASVLTPNVLRSIERAAVRAEDEMAARLGDQIQLYLRDQRTLPPVATWTAALAAYSDLAAIDIQRNSRLNNRLLVYDTTSTPNPRALLLSSMRAGLNLPSAASVSANFQTIWQTADDLVPSTLNWAGWAGVANSGEYLVVERMNFRPIYLEELQTHTLTLNNTSSGATAKTASYRISYANGTTGAAVNLAAGTSATLAGLREADRVDLYAAASAGTLNYSYVVSARGRTIDFNGTQWTPQ